MIARRIEVSDNPPREAVLNMIVGNQFMGTATCKSSVYAIAMFDARYVTGYFAANTKREYKDERQRESH